MIKHKQVKHALTCSFSEFIREIWRYTNNYVNRSGAHCTEIHGRWKLLGHFCPASFPGGWAELTIFKNRKVFGLFWSFLSDGSPQSLLFLFLNPVKRSFFFSSSSFLKASPMDERLGKAKNIRSSASPFLRCISMWGWTLWQLRWKRVKWRIKAHSCPLSEPTTISQLKLRRTFWAERNGQIWTVPSEAQEIPN